MLQNAGVAAFTISELSRVIQQGLGVVGSKTNLPSPPNNQINKYTRA